MAPRKMKRILVLGFDGLDYSLVVKWLKELPGFRELRDYGMLTKLKSTIPFKSPAAWSSFITGKNPAKHGILDFYAPEEPPYGRIKLVDFSRLRRHKAFWDYISNRGMKVGIAGVPMTYPPWSTNGFMISSSPLKFEKRMSIPNDLINRFDPKLSFGTIGPETIDLFRRGEDVAYKEALLLMRLKFDALKHILNKYPDFNVHVFVFQATDWAQHWLWNEEDLSPIKSIYALVDEVIGYALNEIASDCSLVVMSDHGFGKICDKEISLNQWLCQKGFLNFRTGVSITRMYSYARKVILKMGMDRLLMGRLGTLPWKAVMGSIDWRKTLAFTSQRFLNTPLGGICINRNCIYFDRMDHDDVVDEISAGLLDLRVDGERVVTDVWRREEIFTGPYLNEIPDIVFELKDDYTVGRQMGREFIMHVERRWLRGYHKKWGVLGVYGELRDELRSQADKECFKITDLAPMVLRYMGMPIPQDMDSAPQAS